MKRYESREDYLEALLVLQRKKPAVRPVDLAEYMGYSKPSISYAIGVLKEGGFLVKDRRGHLHLTDAGREVAEQIYERHRFFTELLTKVGVSRELAEAEACRIEHCVSEETFEKLKQYLDK